MLFGVGRAVLPSNGVPGAVRAKHTSTGFLSFVDPLAQHLVSFPQYAGLLDMVPYPYTMSVVTLTLALRTCVSLPTVLWQRRRNDRLSQVVVPEWKVWQRQIPAAVMKQHAPKQDMDRRTEWQIQWQIRRQLREKWEHLTTLYNCSPMRTTLVSLAVHVPLFLLVTWLLRQGAVLPDTPLAQEVMPWWSADEATNLQAMASRQILLERGVDANIVDRLTKVGGPTLADRDATQIMPLVVGSLNMINVELVNWTRQRRAAREAALGLSSQPHLGGQALPEEPRRVRVLSDLLRAGAIASIPVATQVPSVRCV